MENRRGHEHGRRAEDSHWLSLEKQVANLAAAQLASQSAFAKLEIEVGRLSDHVEDVDDHLRGVAGKESIDTRVALLERKFDMHGVMLNRISQQFTEVHKLLEDSLKQIRSDIQALSGDVSAMKVQRAIAAGTSELKEKSEATRLDRLKAWLSFWGPPLALIIGLVVPLATLVFQNWEKVAKLFHHEPMTVEKLEKEIAEDRKGPRGKAVEKKKQELRDARKELGIPPGDL